MGFNLDLTVRCCNAGTSCANLHVQRFDAVPTVDDQFFPSPFRPPKCAPYAIIVLRYRSFSLLMCFCGSLCPEFLVQQPTSHPSHRLPSWKMMRRRTIWVHSEGLRVYKGAHPAVKTEIRVDVSRLRFHCTVLDRSPAPWWYKTGNGYRCGTLTKNSANRSPRRSEADLKPI